MKMRPRIYYTEEQKAMMWDRWQKGESLSNNSLWRRHRRNFKKTSAPDFGFEK